MMSRQPFILFITGISTAGKSTVYEALRHDQTLGACLVRDIDEDGVPAVGRRPWRAYRVEQLLEQALHDLQDGKSTIICGISKPHEVIESKQYDPRYPIHFLLLDISFATFQERIQVRLKQRMAEGEQWDDEARQALWAANSAMLRTLRHSVINQRNGHVLQTEGLDEPAMLAAVKQVIAGL